MGFSFNPFHAVTRAVGIPDKAAQIISDVLPITALFGAAPYGVSLYRAGGNLVGTNQKPRQSHQVTQGGTPYFTEFQPNPSTGPINYGGYGGSFDYGYQPATTPYGGDPWGYSMTYSPPSIQQYQTYSAATPAPADRSWEDLIAGALPFFL